jgi:hypothetical protein
VLKPFTDFQKNGTRKDGLGGQCRYCRQGQYWTIPKPTAREPAEQLCEKERSHSGVKTWREENDHRYGPYNKHKYARPSRATSQTAQGTPTKDGQVYGYQIKRTGETSTFGGKQYEIRPDHHFDSAIIALLD